MAATDRSPTTLTGFLRSLPRTLWPSHTGCYDAGGVRLGDVPFASPVAGLPVPGRETDFALEASGEQSADIYIRCNRQGMAAPDDVGLLWSPTSVSAGLRGCDLPIRWTGNEPLDGSRKQPAHILALRSGAVGLVYGHFVGGVYEVRYRRRDPATGLWSAEVTLTTFGTDPWPCLLEVPLERGGYRLICYSWRASQIRAYYSDDEGATWTFGSDVLEFPISTTVYPVADRKRIRAAWSGGQILLVAHLYNNILADGDDWRDVLGQWASSDGGGMFQVVEIMDGTDLDHSGGYPDIAVRDGVFHVGYVRENAAGQITPHIAILSDAWEVIRTASTVELTDTPWRLCASVNGVGPFYFTDGELALWYDDDGAIYLTVRNTNGWTWPIARNTVPSSSAAYWRSTGTGLTWTTYAQTWTAADGGDAVGNVSCTAHHGRTLGTWDGYDTAGHTGRGNLHIAMLGGWSTLTHPTYSGSLTPWDRVAWDHATFWRQVPSASWWGITAAFGAEVISYTGDTLTAGAGNGIYADTIASLPGSVADGILYEHEVEVTPAVLGYQCYLRGTIGDGANAYAVEVRVGAAGLQFWDVVAGASLGTVAYAGGKIRVAVGLTSGAARAWFRYSSPVGHEDGTWTEVGAGVPTSTGAAGAHLLEFIVIAGNTVVWSFAAVTSDARTGQKWDAAPTAATLMPRTALPSGTWFGRNVSLSSRSGPAYPPDTWTISRSWEYGPDNLDPRGYTPSPRAACLIPTAELPAGTTEIRIAWTYSTSDETLESDLLGAYLDGVLSSAVSVHRRTGAAWVLHGTLSVDSVTATGAGKVITADLTTGGGSERWLRGELDGAGCTVISAAPAGEARVIFRSRGGSTIAADGFPLQVELDAIPAIVAATLRIWPRRGLIYRPAGAATQGVQIRIPVNVAPATIPGHPVGGYYGLSVLAFGPILVVGHRAQSYPGRVLEPGVEVQTARDGTRSAEETGPAARALTLQWDAVPEESLTDYVTSNVTSPVPIAYRQDASAILEIVAHEGGRYPGVAVVEVARANTTEKAGRGLDYLYGRIMGDAAVDPATGTSAGGRGSWVIEEER